ncbi:MAG: SRPBCC family protein [Hyphomicrobium sp.]|nr:SRPBCC family protein [Hyphomicrobium sp.]
MTIPKSLLALLAVNVAVSMPVQAASLAVGKKAEIKVDAKKMDDERAGLWKKFGAWCAIKDWHPAVASCEESKEGDAEFRTLTLKDGAKIKEKLTERKDFVYKYMIVESPLPVKNYEAQFALTPDDDDEDEINFAWSAVFDAEGKPDKEARGTIDGIFKAGLENIKAIVAAGAAK